MGTALHAIGWTIGAAAADVGQGIGMSLVWCADHPLVALPGGILLVLTIVRSLAD